MTPFHSWDKRAPSSRSPASAWLSQGLPGQTGPWDLNPGLSLQSWGPWPRAVWPPRERSIHYPLKGAWPQQPYPREVPQSPSCVLKASRLVFNKEDELVGKPGVGGGHGEAADRTLCTRGREWRSGQGVPPLGGPGLRGALPRPGGRWLCAARLSGKPTGYCAAFVRL